VLDEIGRLLVEAKSLREAMSLVTRADAILGRVARWAHQSPTPDEVRRTLNEAIALRAEVASFVGSTR
jgi:hypothetical protein